MRVHGLRAWCACVVAPEKLAGVNRRWHLGMQPVPVRRQGSHKRWTRMSHGRGRGRPRVGRRAARESALALASVRKGRPSAALEQFEIQTSLHA